LIECCYFFRSFLNKRAGLQYFCQAILNNLEGFLPLVYAKLQVPSSSASHRCSWQRSRLTAVTGDDIETISELPRWIRDEESFMDVYGHPINLRQYLNKCCTPFPRYAHLRKENVIYYLVIRNIDCEEKADGAAAEAAVARKVNTHTHMSIRHAFETIAIMKSFLFC